jgi:hypothetical protein
MKFWKATLILLTFTVAVNAQEISPAVDFFMHNKFYDTFLRDYFRFNEPNPLRVEYFYTSWMDGGEESKEYADHLYLEGLFPIYRRDKLVIDIPFRYSRVPVWSETKPDSFGCYINAFEPSIMTRWTITQRFKSIVGWEYNIKGDGDRVGDKDSRKICFLKTYLSYDLHDKINMVAGVRFDRYYYDTEEESDVYELTDRLYYHPAIMLNWHPNKTFTLLLGIPGSGFQLALGDLIKVETRANIDEEFEVGLKVKPIEQTNLTLRFIHIPYSEVPVKPVSFQGNDLLAERLYYTYKSIILEIGRELNPASVVSLAFRYGLESNLELKDRLYENSIKLDGKPVFAIGVTFAVDLGALAGAR